ncbi:MAG: SpoIVB peptidase S55 domain-containing protein [Sedimentisphaerales bacterium]|jgi:hypothetical protein
MAQGLAKFRACVLGCLLLGVGLCEAAEQPKEGIPKGLDGVWDPARYIGIDEIRPGMEAYCLTVYKGTEVEKFGLEVLSVIRNFMPGRDVILVRGTDERFIHSGPVAGCSGSPVYIDGRLAGAYAYGWIFSKDPIIGVTPIAEMLVAGGPDSQQGGGVPPAGGVGLSFDFSRPLDFSQVEKKFSAALSSSRGDFAGATVLPSPLIVSGVPEAVRADLDGLLGPLGFMVVSGGGGGSAAGGDVCDVKLAPGACLMVPLVTGDITFNVVGTVTEVRGDEIYGFGHAFLGYGAVDLPMATGQVHTVMSSVMRSFKIATSGSIVGALTMDNSTAVRGKVGRQARMIPLTIKVSRYNDSQPRRYNCQVVDNRTLTPMLLKEVVGGAVLMRGDLSPDNTLRYKATIELEGAKPVTFENISTGMDLAEMMRDSVSPAALLMNNPYRPVSIKSLDFDVTVSEKNVTSAIWSVGLSSGRVKRGEEVAVEVVTESFQSEKRKYQFNFVVPENTPAGTYQLMVCGGYDYEEFLRKAVPHRFVPENLDTLVGAINDILAIGRDELHCILVLPTGGVAMENAELPELPATKAMVLGDAKRAITMQAFPGWIDKSVRTGAVIIDKKIMNITVE